MKKLAIAIVLIIACCGRLAAGGEACHDRATGWLQANYPPGHQVAMKTAKDFFDRWLNCSMEWSICQVATAVHESVHMISLNNGDMSMQTIFTPGEQFQNIDRMRNTYFNRCEVGRLLKGSEMDSYYKTYLTGESGNQGFNMLLDELNAYTWSVKVFTVIVKTRGIPAGIALGERNGLATFMLYTALYIRCAKTDHQDDYKKMCGSAELKKTVSALWKNAVEVLAEAQKFPRLGTNDAVRVARMKEVAGEVQALIGSPDSGGDIEETGNEGSSINNGSGKNIGIPYDIRGTYQIKFSDDTSSDYRHSLIIDSVGGTEARGTLVIDGATFNHGGDGAPGNGTCRVPFTAKLQVLAAPGPSIPGQPVLTFAVKIGGSQCSFRMAPTQQESGRLIWGGSCRVTPPGGSAADITVWSAPD